MLWKLLGAIYPHMGCMPYDVNDKLAKMTFNCNETYDSIHERFLDIDKEVELFLYRVSNTAVVDEFMTLLMSVPDVIPRLSTIYVELKTHIKKHGPNVDFRFTLEGIYDYLICFDIVVSSEIKAPSHNIPTGPQAFAAIVTTDKAKLLPDSEARNTTTLTPRNNSCPVCYLRHNVGCC